MKVISLINPKYMSARAKAASLSMEFYEAFDTIQHVG